MEWKWHEEKNRTAISIVRVSSRKQEDNTSLEFQEKQIERYCSERHLNIVHIARISESAKDAEHRKQYHKAIGHALKNKIRHVLFYMNDREARNMTDIENNNKLIKSGDIVVHHVQERKVYWKYSSVTDFLMRNISSVINHDFSLRQSVKIDSGQRAKVEMGWYPFSMLPLGYVWQRETNSIGKERREGLAKIAIDPREDRVRLVQREFELRSMGLSAQSIKNQIIQEGLLPSDTKGYAASAIDKRLKNKLYWGYFDHEGVEYKGKHPLIIPNHILRLVKKSFEADQGFSTKPLNRESLFGRWIRCGHSDCGLYLVYDPKKKVVKSTGEVKIHHYYVCSNSRLVHQSMKGLSITEDRIFDQLAAGISNISITKEFASDILAAIIESDSKAKESSRKRIQELRQMATKLDIREEKAYEDYSEGILDPVTYKRVKTKIAQEKECLERQLELETQQYRGESSLSVKKIVELCINAKSLIEKAPKQKRAEYLKAVYSNPIYDNGTLRYDFQKPFAVMAKISGNPLWWRLAGSNR